MDFLFCIPPFPAQVRRGAWYFVLVAWVALTLSPALALAQPPSRAVAEYELKAVFLFSFVKFVKWPATAFPNAVTPLTIGVLGADPFAGALERTVRGETVGGRRLRIHQSFRVEDLKNCQVVFVSKSERARIGDELAVLNTGAVLTVGETDQFSQAGGVITLIMEEGRVTFKINVGVSRRTGLEISSKLLRLGKTVTSG